MNSPAVAVDLDPQAEGLEDRPLQLGIGVGQLVGQVGKRCQHGARVVRIDGGAVASGLIELLEDRLRFLALTFEAADTLADDDRIDPCLDCGELTLDLLVDFAELARDPLPRGVALRLQGPGKGRAFGLEVVQRLRPEDPGGEEAVDQVGQLVLAHVLPFAVAYRLGRAVAVGSAVAAGVIGRLAFSPPPLHPQGVVPGRAVDDPAQQVEAFLRAPPPISVAGRAPFHLRLRALELLLGDQRLVLLVGLDPFLAASPGNGTDPLLVGAGVEPVPVEVAGVDRVFEHRFDRRLGPFAGCVAPAVDVTRRWWAAWPVEVVGDLLVAGAGEEALEDLGDHGSLVALDHQA